MVQGVGRPSLPPPPFSFFFYSRGASRSSTRPSLPFLPASPERLLYYLIVTCALFTERVRDGEIVKIGPVRDPTPRRAGDFDASYLTNIGVRSLGYDIAFREHGHRGERDGTPQPYPCSVLLPQ